MIHIFQEISTVGALPCASVFAASALRFADEKPDKGTRAALQIFRSHLQKKKQPLI